MSYAEHDWHAAGSQFATHKKSGLETTPINTKGYETLLSLKQLFADCIVFTESSYLKMKNRSSLCQR
ncbi:hypothetical protein HN51_041071, partial [Arachis hypogaea]